MWVQILKTYSGPLGLFVKDEKKDVPKEIVDKLPKGICKSAPAPWDEKIDHKAIDAAELKKNAALTIEKTVALHKKVEGFALQLVDLSNILKAAQDIEDNAKKLMEKAQKNMGTEKGLKHFNGLKRHFQYAHARLQIAGADFFKRQAEKIIAELELEDAEKLAAKLAQEAGIGFEPAKGVTDADGQTVSSPSEKSVSNKMN
jgi:hypothetical protein